MDICNQNCLASSSGHSVYQVTVSGYIMITNVQNDYKSPNFMITGLKWLLSPNDYKGPKFWTFVIKNKQNGQN